MRTYKEIEKDLGYDFSVECPIELEWTYFAYKGGEVFSFSNAIDARKVSSNVERVKSKDSEIRHSAWWKIRQAEVIHVTSTWEKELRRQYLELSDEVYYICHGKAYDRGHHAGYDEVASYLDEYVDFAKEIMGAT